MSHQAIKALTKDDLETQLFESRLASKVKDAWYEKQENHHKEELVRKDDNHAKNMGQVVGQLKDLVADFGETKELVGKLQERLLQLEAPKPEESQPNSPPNP